MMPATKRTTTALRLLACVPMIVAAAASHAAPTWVKDELTIDGEAQIYLAKEFSKQSGKFKSVPESMLDETKTIQGNFIVGSYRYLYKKPDRDTAGRQVDEMVSTEILDCERQFYGTLKQVHLYKGKPVSESKKPLADVQMVQTSGVNLGSKLCALYAHQPVAPLDRRAVNNPNYNPKPSAKDIDALIDKYEPAKKGSGK